MNERIVTEWYLSIFDVMETARDRGLVLCGNGYWNTIAKRICALFNVKPVCTVVFSEGNNFDNKILNISQALKLYPNSIFISCADSVSERNQCNMILKENGVLSKESGLLFWRYAFLLDTGVEVNDKEIKIENQIKTDDVENLLFLNHMIHSGSMYFQETIDGHPNLLTIFFLGGVFKFVYKNRLSKLKGEKLWMELCAYMAKEFYTELEKKDSKFPEATTLNASNFFFDKDGSFDWKIAIDPAEFRINIKNCFSENRTYSFGEILKGLFVSYANSAGKSNAFQRKFWIVYDIHDPSMKPSDFEEFNLSKEFHKIKYCCLIREPLSHFASICKLFKNATKSKIGDKLTIANIRQFISVDCGHSVLDSGSAKSFVIRFEDLKQKHFEIMKKFCQELDIKYDECLDKTTFNNVVVYDRRKTDNGYIYTTGTDASALTRKFDTVFTDYDISRLSYLFSNFLNEYYPEYSQTSVVYSKDEMTSSYKCFDDLNERLDYAGDVNGESKKFINSIYDCILKELEMHNSKGAFYKLL